MIAVIADDFTGAAEIGGIGLRYGLRVLIETNIDEDIPECDLLVIAADTRSLNPNAAALEIENITRKLLDRKPSFVFKKLDSVLRGHIAKELEAQMKMMQKKRAVIIAGNPYFNRLIKNGRYTIEGIPLSKTFFANDPEFPVKSSHVLDIIQNNRLALYNLNVDEVFPEQGLIVGDVCCEEDMLRWGEKIDDETIAAGGSGFFNVLLEKKYKPKLNGTHKHIAMQQKSLFVFGSMYPKSEGLMQKMADSDILPVNMPEKIFKSETNNLPLIERWAREVTSALDQGKRVVITVNHTDQSGNGISARVKENLGLLVRAIFKKTEIHDLFIEGGATTAVILRNLNISTLYPFREINLGIIQMKVDHFPELCITTKPGSYSWPDDVWIKKYKNTEN
ncbi:MAG TPA: four-carbon acid sugar kinase family protein [Prolixibacteraceae bacterium]|nr:four-carbon acid sugar kinase family protein [Prolixibacteraceae bacterium]